MKIPLLLLLLLVAGFTSIAQQPSYPDYVVTSAGDTLRGQVRQLSKQHDNIRLFRPGQGTREYSATEIRSYGNSSGPEGVSRLLKPQDQPRFVVPLVEGPVSLFAGEDEQQNNRFYLQLPDSAYLIEIAPLTYQLTLNRQMGDCPSLDFGSSAFQRRYPYSFDGLSALVLAYNRCHAPASPSYLVKHGTNIRVAWGLTAGLNTAQFVLSHPSSSGSSHRRAEGYQAGLVLNTYGRSPFSLQLEAVYTALRSEYGPFDLYSFNSGSPGNTVFAQIRYNKVQLPALLRFSMGHGAIQPFVNAGLLVALSFNNMSTTSFPVAQTPAQLIAIGRFHGGFAAGAGTSIKLSALPTITAEFRYTRLNNNADKKDVNLYKSSQTTLFQFNTGIMF